MKVGIPVEILETEGRVAATPKTVERLIKQGFEVFIQSNAGLRANFSNEEYVKSGAKLIDSADLLFQNSDIVLKVQPLTHSEIDLL